MNLTIPDTEYKELLEHSKMLGQIAIYVEDFCDGEDTTLVGVLRLLSEYHTQQSHLLYDRIEQLREQNK